MSQTQMHTPLEGRIRIDERPKVLATRLEAGEIAVINMVDIDRDTAAALIAASPVAILNAQPSQSGRHKVLGPTDIIDAGIVLIDDLGQDIMTLREGQSASISDQRVLVDGTVVASGHIVTHEDAAASLEDSSSVLAAFNASIEDYLKGDGAVVLEGQGVPLVKGARGRTILIVTDASASPGELRALARWRSEVSPLVIAVDGGADTALKAGISLDVVVGDADLMSEKAIRRARSFIVRVGGDGLAPGRTRLDRMGIVYEQVSMGGSSLDAALVVAAHTDAPAIVTVGVSYTPDTLVDKGRALIAPAFFSRLVAGEKLIPSGAVAATFKPRPRGWALVMLALVAFLSLGVALWSTPWGHDALEPLMSFFTSLFGSQGGAQ